MKKVNKNVPKIVNPYDVELPHLLVHETGYINSEGFWVQKWTVVKNGKVVERVTPFKECPYVLQRWLSESELERLSLEFTSTPKGGKHE